MVGVGPEIGGEEAGKVGSWISLEEHPREGVFSVEFGPDSEKSFEVRAKGDLTQEWPCGLC